jgi:AraC-like DNA-binding protein
MVTFKKVPPSGDPSDRVQHFTPVNPSIICCRYWWLENWKSREMSFPYWRLYWNKNEGAYVKTHKNVFLSPDRIILIPPNTSFSTDIVRKERTNSGESYDLTGSRVIDKEDERKRAEEGKILHLFIHFNLGLTLDRISKKIYTFEITLGQKELITNLIDKLLNGISDFDPASTLEIHQLIFSALLRIPEEDLQLPRADSRINKVLEYIEYRLGDKLSNEQLAGQVYMSKNSFTRFFREQMHCSPQEYVRKIRIDKACNMLDRGNVPIDEIAEVCGFTDRFHFSKVFKKIKGIPPAEYKRRFILGSKNF